MSKRPYIQFYVGDWLKDPALKKCSPETRGIWFDFLCDMHEEQSGGVLTLDRDRLCQVGRCSRAELDRALDELAKTHAAEVSERNGVVTVVNRRMKRAWDLSSNRSDAGSKGIAKRQQNAEDEVETEIASEAWLSEPEFSMAWEQWKEHRNELKKPLTAMATIQQIRKLKEWGKNRAIAALNYSIANGWQGIFEPQSNGKVSGSNGHRQPWQIESDITSFKNQRSRLLGVYSIETLRQSRDPKCVQYDQLTAKLETLKQELAGA